MLGTRAFRGHWLLAAASILRIHISRHFEIDNALEKFRGENVGSALKDSRRESSGVIFAGTTGE